MQDASPTLKISFIGCMIRSQYNKKEKTDSGGGGCEENIADHMYRVCMRYRLCLCLSGIPLAEYLGEAKA